MSASGSAAGPKRIVPEAKTAAAPSAAPRANRSAEPLRLQILSLQRAAGNAAVADLLAPPGVQRAPATAASPASGDIGQVTQDRPDLTEFAQGMDETGTEYLKKIKAGETKLGKAGRLPYVREAQLTFNLEAGFGAGLAVGLANHINPDDLAALNEGMGHPVNNAAFNAGEMGGIAVGAVEDVVDNIKGILALGKLLWYTSPMGLIYLEGQEAMEWAKDPKGRLAFYKQQLIRVQQIAEALNEFGEHLQNDPGALLLEGRELGIAVGELAGTYFADEVIKEPSYLKKGYAVGKIIGIIAVEIALLVFGEQIVKAAASGARAVGMAARDAAVLLKESQFATKVFEILEKTPGGAKLIEALEGTKMVAELRELSELRRLVKNEALLQSLLKSAGKDNALLLEWLKTSGNDASKLDRLIKVCGDGKTFRELLDLCGKDGSKLDDMMRKVGNDPKKLLETFNANGRDLTRTERALAGPTTAAAPGIGQQLKTVDDVLANPELLRGKSPAEVADAIRGAPGWREEKLGQGSRAGQGWVFREYSKDGNATGRVIRWHPGGGHHGPNPYWRVSGGLGGKSIPIPGGP